MVTYPTDANGNSRSPDRCLLGARWSAPSRPGSRSRYFRHEENWQDGLRCDLRVSRIAARHFGIVGQVRLRGHHSRRAHERLRRHDADRTDGRRSLRGVQWMITLGREWLLFYPATAQALIDKAEGSGLGQAHDEARVRHWRATFSSEFSSRSPITRCYTITRLTAFQLLACSPGFHTSRLPGPPHEIGLEAFVTLKPWARSRELRRPQRITGFYEHPHRRSTRNSQPNSPNSSDAELGRNERGEARSSPGAGRKTCSGSRTIPGGSTSSKRRSLFR